MENDFGVKVVAGADCQYVSHMTELDMSLLIVGLELNCVDNRVICVRRFVKYEFGFLFNSAPH